MSLVRILPGTYISAMHLFICIFVTDFVRKNKNNNPFTIKQATVIDLCMRLPDVTLVKWVPVYTLVVVVVVVFENIPLAFIRILFRSINAESVPTVSMI